jgi:hypothetical protein
MFDNMKTTVDAFGVASVIIGGLLTSGALAWWMKMGSVVRLAQSDSARALDHVSGMTPKVSVLETNVAHVQGVTAKISEDHAMLIPRVTDLEGRVRHTETITEEIRSRMGKLDKIDEMGVMVQNLVTTVTDNLVPRKEIEMQQRNDDQRMARIEQDVRDAALPPARGGRRKNARQASS